MVFSFCLIAAATLMLRRIGYARWLTLAVQGGTLAFVMLCGIELGLRQITGEGVNDAVFYHMKTGLGGGDISQYATSILGVVASIAAVSIALWKGNKWLQPGGQKRVVQWDASILAFIIGALLVHPVSTATISHVMRFALVEQQTDRFHDPALPSDPPQNPRNLVIIYLESLERTYMDTSRFAGLTPRLSALEEQAISFTEIGQTTGAGFTIGGMVASQCGVPLILSGGANSMQVSRFMSGATCLGDILSEANYTLSFLGGASVEFAGKGAFYESHGFDEVTGLDQLLPSLDDPAYLAEWGLQDDTLFALGRDRFQALSEAETPFVLTMLTLDTHHPNGHADTNRACAGMQYGDGSNPMLNSVLCDDYLAGAFIEDIMSGPHAANTVIAVMSDHLAMVNTATDLLNGGPRRNLFMLLDPQAGSIGQSVDRVGTTLDIGPTLLNHLGFDIPAMGLGVDLMGPAPTLPETLSVTLGEQRALDEHVMGFQSEYARLWSYPDLSEGLYVNIESGGVHFGHNAFKLPALFAFDDENTIIQATLGDRRAEETLSQSALNLPSDTRYLWFDDCHALGAADPAGDLSERDGLCVLNGERTVGGGLRPLPRSQFLSRRDLTDILDDVAPFPWEADPEGLLQIGQMRGDLPVPLAFPALAQEERGILLQSSGFGAGSSFIRRQTTDRLDAGEDWVISRGLNLIGITANGRAEILDRIDQCDPDFDPAAHKNWLEVIDGSRDMFAAHVLAVHDTAYCGSSIAPFAELLQGLDLPTLQAAKMREPYLAIMLSDGQTSEFSNRHLPRVRVFLDPLATGQTGKDGDNLDANNRSTPSVPSVRPDPNQRDVISGAPQIANVAITQPPVTVSATTVETERCTAPPQTDPSLPATPPLQIGEVLSGQDMAGRVGFISGWWGQEQNGRWMGTRETQLSVVLPETADDLRLSLDLATPENRRFQLLYQDEVIAAAVLAGRQTLTAGLANIPKGSPVVLRLRAVGDPMTCPTARGSGNDPRQMAAMLMSLRVDEISTQQPDMFERPEATAAQIAMETVELVNGCQGPQTGNVDVAAINPLPIGRALPLSEATELQSLSFEEGWWPEEAYGRWMGADRAALKIVLPESQDGLSLVLTTAAFGANTTQVVVSYQGNQIARQETGDGIPLVLDVGSLPRGSAVQLDLSLTGKAIECPATRNAGSDKRALGLMVQSIRLDTLSNAPFGRSIAHGGGRLDGAAITNSFDALAANLNGFSIFEIDLNWTSDGDLVCLHDWQDGFTGRFGAPTQAPLTHELFRELLAASPQKPRNCDLEGLAGWMRANPNIRIVTDVKSNPVTAHEMIAARHPDLLDQFVPQAYQPEEIDLYRTLGFSEIIWTLYRFGNDRAAIIDGVMRHGPTALAMPLSFADAGLLAEVNQATRLPIYVHTINDPKTAGCLINQGAAGIYSDDLEDNDIKLMSAGPSFCTEGL